MFRDTKAFSGCSVDDVEEAQRFYDETLGLETSTEHGVLELQVVLSRGARTLGARC